MTTAAASSAPRKSHTHPLHVACSQAPIRPRLGGYGTKAERTREARHKDIVEESRRAGEDAGKVAGEQASAEEVHRSVDPAGAAKQYASKAKCSYCKKPGHKFKNKNGEIKCKAYLAAHIGH